MSCYFDSYFLPGKQTGVLGPGPGRRPEGRGRDLPLLTRAPCRKQELSRRLSCSTVVLHPTACPPVFTRGREGGGQYGPLVCAQCKSCLGHSSQPSLTCPSCEMGTSAPWIYSEALYTTLDARQPCVCCHPYSCYKTQGAVAQGQKAPGDFAVGG